MSGGFATFGGPRMRRQNPNVEENSERFEQPQDRVHGQADDTNDGSISSQSKARRN